MVNFNAGDQVMVIKPSLSDKRSGIKGDSIGHVVSTNGTFVNVRFITDRQYKIHPFFPDQLRKC